MVSTLTVGTNTYVTLAETNTYLGDSPRAASWAFLGPDQQKQCILTAARLFERQCWQGAKTNPVQDMQHPRTGLTDKNGVAIPSGTVAQQIKDGQMELAFELSLDTSAESTAGTGSNIKALRAGSASIDYFRPTGGPQGQGSPRFPPSVMELIQQFLCGFLGSGGGIAGAYASGTDVPSSFSDINPYGFTEGLP